MRSPVQKMISLAASKESLLDKSICKAVAPGSPITAFDSSLLTIIVGRTTCRR